MASKTDLDSTVSALAAHDVLWSHLSDHVRERASIRGPLSLEDLDSRDWRATILRWTQRADVQVTHPPEALLGLRAAVADMDHEEVYFLVMGLAVRDERGDTPDSPNDQAPAADSSSHKRRSA